MQVAIDNTRCKQNESVTARHTLHVVVPAVFKKKRIIPRCLHGIIKQQCRICSAQQYCDHSRRKSTCRDCRIAFQKTIIRPKSPNEEDESVAAQDTVHVIISPVLKKKRIRPKCTHGILKQGCKECSPHNFCAHKRFKKNCRDCGTFVKKTYIPPKCPHGNNKTSCKQCFPQYFCKHDRQKYTCVQCAGTSICQHNKRRSNCVDCEGTGVCIHKRQKIRCVQCMGRGICQHMKRMTNCHKCMGTAICSHKKLRSTCHKCGGSEICSHGKIRRQCPQCPLCHVHMCEKHAVISTGSVAGYCWREVEGSQEPSTGNEIHNELLAAALLQKMEFTNADLDSFHQDFFTTPTSRWKTSIIHQRVLVPGALETNGDRESKVARRNYTTGFTNKG